MITQIKYSYWDPPQPPRKKPGPLTKIEKAAKLQQTIILMKKAANSILTEYATS